MSAIDAPAPVQPSAATVSDTSSAAGVANMAPGITAPQDVEATQATQSAPRRMCPHCGNIAGRGKFCISCGKQIDIPQNVDVQQDHVQQDQNEITPNEQIAPQEVDHLIAGSQQVVPADDVVDNTASKREEKESEETDTMTLPAFDFSPYLEGTGNIDTGSSGAAGINPPTASAEQAPDVSAQQQAIQNVDTANINANAETPVREGLLKRIPPPTMPSVIGIRPANPLAPRVSSQPANGIGPSSPSSIQTQSTGGVSSTTSSYMPSVTFRPASPSWLKRS
jgi:hypothetical protein